MAESWPEIAQALSEKRRELVVKGDEMKKRIEDDDGSLPSALYDLKLLNFLELNSVPVVQISTKIGGFANMTQFYVRRTSVAELPESICDLTLLKVLDVSENRLEALPENLGKLKALHTFNASHNAISNLPKSISDLPALAVVDISQNRFAAFPEVLSDGAAAARISELYASHNQIDDVSDSVKSMTSLKVLDMSDNKITELTQAIGTCIKLKQVDFKSNPLKDKRLKKLIEQNSSQKSILDYIRSKGRKLQTNAPSRGGNDNQHGSKGARKKLKGKKIQEELEVEAELAKFFIDVLKINSSAALSTDQDDPFRIIMYDEVKEVRPFVVGCVLRNLNLEGSKFKNFITLQTRLHEEICGKRTVATIATHDMDKLKGSSLIYDAQPPSTVKIQPLGRSSKVSAIEFYRRLCAEAEAVRKDKKRNQVSGIHKYLSLLKDSELFAFLRRNSDDTVISLPPLTNCEATKISPESTDVFVEVTGAKSLRSCKDVMDELLKQLIELGFTSRPIKGGKEKADFYDDSSDEEGEDKSTGDKSGSSLIVQQVRCEDAEGNLKVLYPSRTDLVFDSKLIRINRS